MRQKFHFDFVGNSKKFFILTLSLMLICLILNIFVFHTELDIQFTGGAIMKYSYSGDNLSENEISKVVQAATKEDVSFQYSKNMSAAATEENANTLSIELTEAKTIDPETEKGVTDALKKAFPDNNFTRTEITSVDPSKGATFFWKCMGCCWHCRSPYDSLCWLQIQKNRWSFRWLHSRYRTYTRYNYGILHFRYFQNAT